jgi:hypothetical protein
MTEKSNGSDMGAQIVGAMLVSEDDDEWEEISCYLTT